MKGIEKQRKRKKRKRLNKERKIEGGKSGRERRIHKERKEEKSITRRMFAALTLRRLRFPSRGSDRKIDGNRQHDDEKTPKKYTREIIKYAGTDARLQT